MALRRRYMRSASESVVSRSSGRGFVKQPQPEAIVVFAVAYLTAHAEDPRHWNIGSLVAATE